MPLSQISMRKGKSKEFRRAVMDGIYSAMRRSFAVPDDDRFMTFSEFGSTNFSYGYRYPNVDRSDDLIIIQITASNNRTKEQKLALYKAINEELVEVGIRPDDIFINIVEVLPENWSFGRGIAQNIE
ncbi:MAG: tautomerase family protein [Hyphomicrobiales bacterium]|nr:tautomerase family protein [Hyphomicrobiales bacterium]